MYARVSFVAAFGVAAMGLSQPACSTPVNDSAAFVTTLGRDTVVMEGFIRSANRLEGRIAVRVPGTVMIHYVLDLGDSGVPTRSVVELTPLGTNTVVGRRVQIDFRNNSALVDIDSAGHHTRTTVPLPAGTFPSLMTGFAASYGLYESPEFFSLYQPLVEAKPGETVHLSTIDVLTGRVSRREFVKRTATQLDADYFRMAFSHLTLDDAGRITKVDATQTTERTETNRIPSTNIETLARRFASDDRNGKGLGAASPHAIERGKVDGKLVVVAYSSPRLRSRTALGGVVPYGEVWRTGANEATTLFADDKLKIGGATIPAGVYSLWTLPKSDGTVELIINGQHGQWGTDYDGSHDVARIPMQVASVAAPLEDFTIAIGSSKPDELSIAWDKFVWSIPIAVVK